MSALREIIARFGVDFDKRPLEEGKESIDGAANALKGLAAAAAATALVVGLKSMIEEVRALGDGLDKASARLGTTTTELQELRHAANLSGVANEELSAGLGDLAKNADAAAQGGATQAALFNRLGVAFKDSRGQLRSVADLLPDIADGLKNNVPQAEQLGIAMQLLGGAGAKMIPMLNGGSEALNNMRAEVAELGGGMSEEAIAETVKWTKTMARLDFAMLSFKSRIVSAILPAVNWVGERITKLTAWFNELTEGTALIESTIVVFSAALTAKLVPALAKVALTGWGMLKPFLPWIAALGAAILLIDELIVTWQGGDTLIRRAIDSIFGEGTTQKVVTWLKDVVSKVADFFANFGTRMDEFLLLLGEDLDRLGRLFVDAWNQLKSDSQAFWDQLVNIATTSGQGLLEAILWPWNQAKEKVAALAATISKAVSAIPGFGGGEINVGGAGATGQLASANAPQTTNNMRGGDVRQTNTVNVTVPAGSPPTLARDIGRAVVTAITPSSLSAIPALAPGF